MTVEDLKYFTFQSRLQTYKKNFKVKNAPLCVPSNFAKAGLYSIATRALPDLVKCFACERELGDWEPEDDPWEEHKRRDSQCPFVRLDAKDANALTLKQLLTLYTDIKILKFKKSFDNGVSENQKRLEKVLASDLFYE